MILPEKRYEHDCEECIYVGQYREYDLYVHPVNDEYSRGSFVARYGKESEYLSCSLIWLLERVGVKE